VKPKYLTTKEARKLHTCMREDTNEGRALRKELVDIVTFWMNGEIASIELAPTVAAILKLAAGPIDFRQRIKARLRKKLDGPGAEKFINELLSDDDDMPPVWFIGDKPREGPKP
jgi:hypothetical protein